MSFVDLLIGVRRFGDLLGRELGGMSSWKAISELEELIKSIPATPGG